MSKKNTKLAVVLILAGLVIGGIAIYGYIEAEKSRADRDAMLSIQQGLLQSQTNTGQANPGTREKIWIGSEACKLTDGSDAVNLCKGLPESYTSNPDIDMAMVNEGLANVKQCASDVIRKTLDLKPADPVTETQIKNLLCDVVETYPKTSDNIDDVTLGQGMYSIMNDFVNR